MKYTGASFKATMNRGLHEVLEVIPDLERIVMVNTAHVRRIAAVQVKTHKVDAWKLAQWLCAGSLHLAHLGWAESCYAPSSR